MCLWMDWLVKIFTACVRVSICLSICPKFRKLLKIKTVVLRSKNTAALTTPGVKGLGHHNPNKVGGVASFK